MILFFILLYFDLPIIYIADINIVLTKLSACFKSFQRTEDMQFTVIVCMYHLPFFLTNPLFETNANVAFLRGKHC